MVTVRATKSASTEWVKTCRLHRSSLRGLLYELVRLAEVALMHLIEGHRRMKFNTPDAYDSTHDLQTRLLLCAHPQERES